MMCLGGEVLAGSDLGGDGGSSSWGFVIFVWDFGEFSA